MRRSPAPEGSGVVVLAAHRVQSIVLRGDREAQCGREREGAAKAEVHVDVVDHRVDYCRYLDTPQKFGIDPFSVRSDLWANSEIAGAFEDLGRLELLDGFGDVPEALNRRGCREESHADTVVPTRRVDVDVGKGRHGVGVGRNGALNLEGRVGRHGKLDVGVKSAVVSIAKVELLPGRARDQRATPLRTDMGHVESAGTAAYERQGQADTNIHEVSGHHVQP